MDDILKMDVGYMVTDLRKLFADRDEFQALSDVLTESLGEFLLKIVFESDEENLTVETLLNLLKEIIERRFNEI
jgi:hypothetical protein